MGQDIENAPRDAMNDVDQDARNGEQDVRDIPSDIGGEFDKAAGKIGGMFGGAERDGRDVEQDGRNAEGDVDRFGQGMDNSYQQGEQQGEQQGF